MGKYLMVITILFIGLSSCNKKWKKPTDVAFHMDINKESSVDGQLSFSGGHFIMESISFDGDRERGNDVIFSRDYETGLSIPFDLSQSIADFDFEIPQGVYKKVDLSFKSTVPCILVEGIYTYSAGGTIPMRFEFDDSEEFDISAEDENNGNIILDTEVISNLKIILDPAHWFQPIPISYFESAEITDLGGINTILINKDTNDEIFNLILDRIDESTEAIFNY